MGGDSPPLALPAFGYACVYVTCHIPLFLLSPSPLNAHFSQFCILLVQPARASRFRASPALRRTHRSPTDNPKQVLVSLAQLNSAVADLSRAYINHANTVLGRNPADLDLGIINSGITNALYSNGLINRPSSPGAKSEAGGGEKKKRKRAPPDPNAPKRALTPYFLYMQHNRKQIAADLGGDNVRPKDVADEGTRRWANMSEAQKAVRYPLF